MSYIYCKYTSVLRVLLSDVEQDVSLHSRQGYLLVLNTALRSCLVFTFYTEKPFSFMYCSLKLCETPFCSSLVFTLSAGILFSFLHCCLMLCKTPIRSCLVFTLSGIHLFYLISDDHMCYMYILYLGVNSCDECEAMH